MPPSSARGYTVLAISIDPRDTPADAAAAKAKYLARYPAPGASAWHFLTGSEAAVRAIADATGFHYRYDRASDQYIHSAALVIAAPDGNDRGLSRRFGVTAGHLHSGARCCQRAPYHGTAAASSAALLRRQRVRPLHAADRGGARAVQHCRDAGRLRAVPAGPPPSASLSEAMAERRWVPFWPPTSAVSGDSVNMLFIAELAVCAAILALVFGLIWVFCIRYRRGNPVPRAASRPRRAGPSRSRWTAATLAAFLGLFVWGADDVCLALRPPAADLEIYVVGKQWMWKVSTPAASARSMRCMCRSGRRCGLCSPRRTYPQLLHPGVPAEARRRCPGTYETMWFRPTETGNLPARMRRILRHPARPYDGQVVVMEPAAYAAGWPTRASANRSRSKARRCSATMAAAAVTAPTARCMPLAGRALRPAGASPDGSTVRADERYIRDSILLPNKEVVAGYPPVMPSFAGQIGEDEMHEADRLHPVAGPASAQPGARR